jgi:Lipocalin-like domain
MRRGRPKFASGDWFRGSPEEIKEEASGYIAYSGPFHTDEAKKTLTHSVFVSLFPNWLGQTQPRVVKIEGDTLHLSTEKPIKSGGKETMSYLTWKRVLRPARDSADTPLLMAVTESLTRFRPRIYYPASGIPL